VSANLTTKGQNLAPTVPQTGRKTWELRVVLPRLDTLYGSRVLMALTQWWFTPV